MKKTILILVVFLVILNGVFAWETQYETVLNQTTFNDVADFFAETNAQDCYFNQTFTLNKNISLDRIELSYQRNTSTPNNNCWLELYNNATGDYLTNSSPIDCSINITSEWYFNFSEYPLSKGEYKFCLNTNMDVVGASIRMFWAKDTNPYEEGFLHNNPGATDFDDDLTFWIKKWGENYEQVYTNSTIEGDYEKYALIINHSSNITRDFNYSAVFFLNNTQYTPTKTVGTTSNYTNFNVSLYVPFVDNVETNLTLYWNYTKEYDDGINIIYSTNYNNQTVYQLYIDECGGVTNVTTLNVTFKDEINNSFFIDKTQFDGTFEIKTTRESIYRNVSINRTGASSYEFCIYPNITLYVDATMLYSSDQYATRTYYYYNKTLTNDTTYDTFYGLSTANSTDVKITATDEDDNNLVGYFVDLMHWYPNDNLYRVVEISKTDADGQVLKHVIYDTVFYKLRWRTGNRIIKETDKFQIHNTLLNYQLRLEPAYLAQYSSLRDVTSALIWTNETNTVTFSWLDLGSEAEYYCLDIHKFSGTAKLTEFTQCSTDREGSIEYTIPNYVGRYIATSYARQSGSLEYRFTLGLIEFNSDTSYLIVGAGGLFIAGLFIMMLAPIGYTLMGIAGVPIFVLIGIGVLVIANVITLGLTVFISMIITAGIIIWRLRR